MNTQIRGMWRERSEPLELHRSIFDGGLISGERGGHFINVREGQSLRIETGCSKCELLFAPHRVLKVFLSRTAQRIPYMTSCRVLRLLGIIILIVCWFLVAWTSAVCQNPDRKLALIDVGYTPDGLQFSMCLLDRWDYMMAVGRRRRPLPPQGVPRPTQQTPHSVCACLGVKRGAFEA